MTTPHQNVIDNIARQRFELDVGGEIAFADYERQGSVVIVPHVEAPIALRGTGASAALMEGVLAILRSRGETIVPICSWAAAYIKRHPEHHNLLR